MRSKRDLVVADLAALFLLLIVLLLGWHEAAAFGLAVLVLMNAIVLLRERLGHSLMDNGEEREE
jgi:hypothetical protein